MIVRILVIDPNPEPGRSDVLCYQVPENSRESALLIELLDSRKLDHTQLSVSKRKRPTKMERNPHDRRARVVLGREDDPI